MITDLHPACQGIDGDLWFPISYDNATGQHQTARAISICQLCPAQLPCLRDAMEEEGGRKLESRYGIRGGFTPAERFNMFRAASRAQTRQLQTGAAA